MFLCSFQEWTGHKGRVTNCPPWVPERVSHFSAFPPQINSENANSQKEINYLHQDFFIHCSIDLGQFLYSQNEKSFDGARGAESIDPERIQRQNRIESSVSDWTKHCHPHLRKKTAESLRIKNGILINSQKALDT